MAQQNYRRDSDQEIMVMNGDYYSSFVPSQRQTFSTGAIVEVASRPRGRPKGSKNKPKAARPHPVPPPHGGDMMAPYILEVPPGKDIVLAISQFSIRKNTGLCVLTASGFVANPSLRLSSAASAPDINCSGNHSILSMSAAFVPRQCPTAGYAPKPLTIGLTTPNGHVIGGLVFGSLVSAGPVYVIATSFNTRSYHKLSCEDEERVRNTPTGEGERRNVPSLRPGGGMPMYSDNLTVVHGFWSTVSRPLQPALSSTAPHGI